MSTRYIARNTDDLELNDVISAVNYFKITDSCLLEDPEVVKYNKELSECKTLDDVAAVYNSHSDAMSDGSMLIVKDFAIDDQKWDAISSKWDAIVNYMDDDIRERVHNELAPCTNKEFLDRYLELDEDFTDLLYSEFSIDI